MIAGRDLIVLDRCIRDDFVVDLESPDLNFASRTLSDADSSGDPLLRNAFPKFCKNLPQSSVPRRSLTYFI